MTAMDDIREEIGYTLFAGCVYGVRTFDSPELRYVGQTRQSIEVRMKAHRAAARAGRRTPFYDWLRTDPGVLMMSLEFVGSNLEDLGDAERRWIAKARSEGHRLLNLAEGGPGPSGVVWTAEQREAARIRSTGRPGTSRPGELNPFFGMTHSAEQRARWSESRRGSITGESNPNFGKFGPEHPAFGRTLSAETRLRLSEQQLGANNPNFGKVLSDEERRVRSEKLKGRPMPSSVRSAHTRHHTNKGVFKDTCRHCQDDLRPADQGNGQ